MRTARVWAVVFGVEKTVVEGVEFDEDEQLLIGHVRPTAGARSRCGICDRRCRGYDSGQGRRRWRSLDLGIIRAVLEADAPRVRCRIHGVVVAAVPWARHGAGHTYCFDDQVAWLAVQTSKTATSALMRVSWRTVGSIITRVAADAIRRTDRFANLRRIGIDEISYKKGHRFLTLVVDHDTGRLIWAAPGRDEATLEAFFDALGEARCAAITQVSADAADWIAKVVADKAPNAVRCADPFHVVRWATKALDEERRRAWNIARGAVHQRRAGRATGAAAAISRARYALWKNPEDLTVNQAAKLAWIAKTDPRLHRAYLLKEGLRQVFVFKGEHGKHALHKWLSWASRSRIPAFVDLARRIRIHRPSIHATLEHNLSNGLIESMNTKIRLLTRIAFGFHTAHPLIALAMLAHGGYRPALPGRTTR